MQVLVAGHEYGVPWMAPHNVDPGPMQNPQPPTGFHAPGIPLSSSGHEAADAGQ